MVDDQAGRQRQDEDRGRGLAAEADALRAGRSPPDQTARPPQIEAGGREAEDRGEERAAFVAAQDIEEQAVAERRRIGIDVEEIGAEAKAEEAVKLMVERA